MQHLLNEEFNVQYHLDDLSTVLRNLGLSYSILHPRRLSRLNDGGQLTTMFEWTVGTVRRRRIF
ncbi:hypothetical protein E6P09_18855 (plasmid) [Haloferax mediterranei ATCC 33500]|uniref:Uncharacterized protein n=1 Tax=Haloferax mediterranei (strain ATCC 33500 / DSM 1411 / JCM 8866 / NBRC 14739 / NCIMB 2177 / R-4) TaxID=523841 RepID=I3R9C6_HALMT|nr:hypothetical protein C439_16993 [Haloferax mediterranei ATCC 33500]QCQ77381.1 hypothetical protein E6P09_18855 [Haloferax mediterranei ATCC 33500]